MFGFGGVELLSHSGSLPWWGSGLYSLWCLVSLSPHVASRYFPQEMLEYSRLLVYANAGDRSIFSQTIIAYLDVITRSAGVCNLGGFKQMPGALQGLDPASALFFCANLIFFCPAVWWYRRRLRSRSVVYAGMQTPLKNRLCLYPDSARLG
jgi:hypothetical protein